MNYLTIKREPTYKNEKDKICRYCEESFSMSYYKDHVDSCKKTLKKCIFCKDTFYMDDYINHLHSCTNNIYKKAYNLYTTHDKELIKVILKKYNEKYDSNDVEYEYLTSLEKKNIFMVNGVKCKSNTYKYYQTVNKINTILCDLVKSL